MTQKTLKSTANGENKFY